MPLTGATSTRSTYAPVTQVRAIRQQSSSQAAEHLAEIRTVRHHRYQDVHARTPAKGMPVGGPVCVRYLRRLAMSRAVPVYLLSVW